MSIGHAFLKNINKYHFMLLTRELLPQALQVVVNSYFVDEGVSRAVRLLESPDATEEILDLMSKIAEDGVSVISVEKSTNALVGVIFSKLRVQPKNGEKNFYEKHMDDCKHPASKLWVKVMNEGSTLCDVYTTYQTDCILDTFLGAVLQTHRDKGILKRLLQFSIEIGEALSVGRNVKRSLDSEQLPLRPIPGAIVGVTTARATQHVTLLYGFRIAGSMKYSSYSYEGVRFDQILGPEPAWIKMMCLPLRKNAHL